MQPGQILIKHIIKILRGRVLVLINVLPLLSAPAVIDKDNITNAVDSVSKLSETISDKGILVVIGAIFILFTILILFAFVKINSMMITNIVKQVNQKNDENKDITQKLLDHFLDEEQKDDDEDKEAEKQEEPAEKPHHAKDLVGLYIDYRTVFKAESKNVINELRCDRVAVYVFHNGNQTLYGLPFIKMSCIFEDTLKGNMTMRYKAHVNLPLHLFNDFVQSLYQDGIFAGNIDDVEIHDNSIREFVSFSNAKSIFMRAIKRENGSLAGFTVCEFNHSVDYSDKEKFTKINHRLKEMNNAIKYIVTDDKFSKKYENQDD